MPAPTPIAVSTIAAQAFRLMELSPISSFADDSDQARAAAEQYPVALDMCLEACDWSFASRLASLPEATLDTSEAADADLPYSYRLPGDCVVLREVGALTGREVWRIDDRLLRADVPAPLRIRYTFRVVNEAILPGTFKVAVAHHLAALLAPLWTGSAGKVGRIEEAGVGYLRQAMRNDRQSASSARYDGRPEQPDWVSEALR